jgi:hypothetical protein
MDKIFSYITKNLISVIGVTILTGTTLTTSALGVMKVANNFEKIKVEVPEVKEMESVSSPTTIPSPTNTSGGSSTVIPHPKASSIIPTVGTPVPTTPPQTQTTASNVQCSVTLFGKQYDVTNLRNTHSGGNIFNCGTDMTAIYQGRHGSDLSRMQQYLITSGGTASSNNSNSAPSNSGNTGSNSNNTSNSGSSSSNTEIHKEEEHKNEREEKDEDHKEEEKERLESFIHNLLRLVVS